VSTLGRLRRWAVRRGPDDRASRRRPGDVVRVIVAVVLLGLLSWHANDPTRTEQSVVRFFESLPDLADTLFLGLYALCSLWAVALLVGAVLLVRRWRLARDLVVAGASTWLIGRLLALFVYHTDLGKAFEVVLDPTDVPRFPLVRVAIAVAMISVASPHLTRPTRRIGYALVTLFAFAAMYLGRAFPTDLVAAFVLGWGIAAAVHLVFGTPDHRPTAEGVASALGRLGIAVQDVSLTPEQPIGRAVFAVETSDGLLRIDALGRDEADAQFLARAWRYLAYRDTAPALFPTRRQQVEYEAYVVLLAHNAGVRVPWVVIAADAPALAMLVQREVEGASLASLDAGRVDDALLDELWRQVVLLHDARVAHCALDAEHVVVSAGVPTLVGFHAGTTNVGPGQLAQDVAQLLAATAAVVGPQRAVDAAIRGIGRDGLASALPALQVPALTEVTRSAFGDEIDETLGELRTAAAAALGIEPPALRQLYRVQPRSLLMAVGALVAVGFLLAQVGDPAEFWNSIKDADWAFVVLAFGIGIMTDVAFAVAFLGTVPIRIRLWPSIELQSAMSFSNLAVPVAADTAIQVRFLQKHGLDLSSAVATGGLLSAVSEILVQVGLFFVALALSPDNVNFDFVDPDTLVVAGLILVFVLLVGVAVVAGVRRIRAAVVPPVARATRTVWEAIKSPSRLALLVGGNIVAHSLYAASLLACLHAFGGSVDYFTLLALNIGVSTIASLVPIPGGGTAVSAVGLSGMLVTFGVPPATVAAAVLAHQLAVSYVPAIPGWFATRDLLRKGLL
jgi:glycosyltransferase 2 family protein